MFDWKDFRTGVLLILAGGLGSIIWAYIESLTKDLSFVDAWNIIYSKEVSVVWLVTSLAIIILLLFKLPKSNKGYTRKQKNMTNFKSFVFTNVNVIADFRINFENDRPVVYNMILSCMLHDPPLRLHDCRCFDADCENSKLQLQEIFILQQIQSQADAYWKNLNK